MRRKLAAGNWKMNGTRDSLAMLTDLAQRTVLPDTTDVVICPPATLLAQATECVTDSSLRIGAQDCHTDVSGPFTGSISAGMIADAGAETVIVGHSERRAAYAESNAIVCQKVKAAHAAGLDVIICIGETEAQRAAGETLAILADQVMQSCPDVEDTSRVVIAYEPIWAIGTGQVASLAQIDEVHDFLREKLKLRFGNGAEAIRLLYGGSVKPGNASSIFACPNVDGALIGGASLNADDFLDIVDALMRA